MAGRWLIRGSWGVSGVCPHRIAAVEPGSPVRTNRARPGGRDRRYGRACPGPARRGRPRYGAILTARQVAVTLGECAWMREWRAGVCRAITGSGAVGDRLDGTRVVVVGSRVSCSGAWAAGRRSCGTQAGAADPGPLEAEQVVELVRGGGELPGPGRGCGKGPASCAARSVGVADRQEQSAGGLLSVARAGGGFLGPVEYGPPVLARVADVVLEGPVGGQRLCGRPGLNRAGGACPRRVREARGRQRLRRTGPGWPWGYQRCRRSCAGRRVRSLAAVAGPPP